MARPDGRSTIARICLNSPELRLDRGDHPRLHHLVADRPCPSLFHTREQKNGLLEPRDRWQNKMERMQYKMDRMRGRMESRGFGGFGFGPPTSGNRAFDEYRTETRRRLEEEQVEFRNFLDRLRHAKDKAEFDQFMAQHKQRPTPPNDQPQQG